LRPQWRSAVAIAGRSVAHARARTGPAEDRHAAALDGRTIDWSQFEPQPGDAEPTPFSFLTDAIDRPQISATSATPPRDARILREAIPRSPLYSGQIEGVGPRYCPSIEDKIVKFPDKLRHQIFLEPEGLDTNEVYVNGMSTSMPIDVQAAMVASIPGLEHAEMIRPGYAIEYDAIDPRELAHTLEVKSIPAFTWRARSTAPRDTRRPAARA
jgi:tRNA uridine 5-carboxymethylaminomethyl modification enzyme